MYCFLTLWVAQIDSRLESFSSGFRKDRAQIDSSDVVLLLTGLVVVFSVLWLVARWSERRVRNDSSLGLFWTLANTHEISWNDRWLLWRLARAKRLTEPALLFLDPRLTSPQSSHHLAPHSTDRLKALRRRLFTGIDRMEEAIPDASEAGADPVSNGPAGRGAEEATIRHQSSPGVSTGGLEEALSALRALNLEDQPVRRPEPPGEPTEKEIEEEESSVPTAEFPSSDAPAIDLYPWLGNDWELTNNDEVPGQP